MWACFNDAFLSIVDKQCGEDELLVRARRPGDIEKVFPGQEVTESLGTDYRYRAVIKRTLIAAAMTERIMGINYANFKGSTTDKKLHDAYMGVWHNMAPLQPGGPYARR